MTIVLSIVQMQMRTCPRPGCKYILPDAALMTTFRQCPKCQLTFRFDLDINAVGLQGEADKLRLAQQHEDLDTFGRRPEPVDVVEIYSDDEDNAESVASDEMNADIHLYGEEAQEDTDEDESEHDHVEEPA